MSNDDIKRATHGSNEHPLKIGSLEIPCYVLEDGTRVLSGRGMQTALGLGQRSGTLLKAFLGKKNIQPYINNGIEKAIQDPIRFIRPGRGGKLAVGFEATVLADICDIMLDARKFGNLTPKEKLIADQCEILTRAFAKVGIISLIDEATGYQEIRDRQALQAILDKYLSKNFAAWAKRFPDEFYKEMFRLKGWKWDPFSVKRPGVVGKYTTDIIYERLAPGITEELESKNPKNEKGRRKVKHHQFLTDDIGHPALAQHLYAIIGFMKANDNWQTFKKMLDQAYPKRNSTIEMNI